MGARLRPPPRGQGRGRRILLPPGTGELGGRHGPLPPPGRTKDSGGHLPNPVLGPSPPRNNRALRGTLSGKQGVKEGAARLHRGRAEGRGGGSVGPGGRGPLRAAPYLGAPRAGQAAGGRRGPRTGPLAAGPSWAGAAAAAAGSPELWVAAAAATGAAAAQQAPLRSGNQRPQARPLRGPGPGSGPDQHLGPDRNRPTCSSSSSGGRCCCARERTRGEAPRGRLSPRRSLRPHGGGGRRVPARLLSASGGRSGRQLKQPPNPPLRSARPPRLASAFRLSPQIRRGGGEGRSQRPPAARRPRARRPRLLPFAAGGLAAAAQQAVRRAAPRPRGPGRGLKGALTPARPGLRDGSRERSARLTVEARK